MHVDHKYTYICFANEDVDMQKVRKKPSDQYR